MSGNRAPADYDENLVKFIRSYILDVGVPPTVDTIIENVEGLSSKSTVFCHLQKLVDAGILVQKNVKGYYYPKDLQTQNVIVPRNLLEDIGIALMKDTSNVPLALKLKGLLST